LSSEHSQISIHKNRRTEISVLFKLMDEVVNSPEEHDETESLIDTIEEFRQK
jgi:hypothetical protein